MFYKQSTQKCILRRILQNTKVRQEKLLWFCKINGIVRSLFCWMAFMDQDPKYELLFPFVSRYRHKKYHDQKEVNNRHQHCKWISLSSKCTANGRDKSVKILERRGSKVQQLVQLTVEQKVARSRSADRFPSLLQAHKHLSS